MPASCFINWMHFYFVKSTAQEAYSLSWYGSTEVVSSLGPPEHTTVVLWQSREKSSW